MRRHNLDSHTERDRRLLYACAFIRAVATGMIGVLLGVYLAQLRLSPAAIGGVVTSGLAGGAVAALAATVLSDRRGRRRILFEISLLGALGTAVVALASTPVVLAAAAFFGMVNGMGRDRGAAMILEQAVLPSTTQDSRRTRAFAVYNILQDVGHACGSLLAGLPTLLRHQAHIPEMASHRLAMGAGALLIAATSIAYLLLSKAVEPHPGASAARVSPQTRRTLTKISALFALDSVAGGFLTTTLLSFFFFTRFGVGEGVIGLLFFGARAINAGSHLVAAWLAGRIGLVNTMVFTHIPSSLFLMTVPFAPTFPIAAALFLLREGLVEMDVPTRQSYVMAVVRPEERTLASGVTNLVRLIGWAVSPALAGMLMQGISLGMPLFIGGGMKIAYDIALYTAFRKIKPPEEGGGSPEPGSG